MRIDRFTEIINIEEKSFLFNSYTGALDEIEIHIANEINKLKGRGSFTPPECGLEEYLIEEMIKRGYITYYSDKEEADERRWLIEKYNEKAKKVKKTASLILDSTVANNWCFPNYSTENSSMNSEDIMDLLKAVSNRKLADEIDLWLLIKNRKAEWTWIVEQANKNRLKIINLYTIIENVIELEELRDWIKTFIPLQITINVKYGLAKYGYLSFSKLNEKTIVEEKKIKFLISHPFFCPFIYKTFFIEKTGNISFCARNIASGEKIGWIDFTTGKLTLQNGWGTELFNSFCGESDKCIYSIFCNKMCPFLKFLHESGKLEDECNILTEIQGIMVEKIRSMV